MKSKRLLPLLLAVPLLCTSCSNAYEVEAVVSDPDYTKITQIGFKDEVSVSLTSMATDGSYFLEWHSDITADQFFFRGTLVGKEVTKVEGVSSDRHTLTVTIAGDCTSSYAEGRFGALVVNRACADVRTDELKDTSGIMCIFVTGEETKLVDRPQEYVL